MPAALAVLAAAGQALAFSPGGLGESTLGVRVVAADGRTPVPGAFVVAREFVSVPQFHGSRDYCFRGDLEHGAADTHAMRLPEVSLRDMGLLERRYRALEAFAYAPGQCFERTANGRSAAEGVRFPGGGIGLGIVPGVAEGSLTVLRSKGEPPRDERLLYLLDFADGLRCEQPHWSERTAANLELLSAAMLDEAQSLAHDRYEKSLAEALRAKLAVVAQFPSSEPGMPLARMATGFPANGFARDFLIAPADMRVAWTNRPAPGGTLDAPAIAFAGRSGTRASRAVPAPFAGAGGDADPARGAAIRSVNPRDAASTRRVIHCRHGPASACDLDERDATGQTALGVAVASLDAEAVGLLLEAGADPSAPNNTAGLAAADALVTRLVTRPPAPGSDDEAHAREIAALLAASPRGTLLRSVHEDLESDPAGWIVSEPSRALLVAARDRLLALPVHADPVPVCQRIEESFVPPMAPRLRVRR